MPKISLKRLLGKEEARVTIAKLLKQLDADCCTIWDVKGRILCGSETCSEGEPYSVEVCGEPIGWVRGPEGAETVAQLLSYVAKQELEKKQVANEALDKYREITRLYDISQKLTACLDVKAVAKLALDEARRSIAGTCGWVMLLNPSTGQLETLAQFGQQGERLGRIELGEGLLGKIVASGMGEIVNEVAADGRSTVAETEVRSLICVPLKRKDRELGAIAIASAQAHSYSAGDLKLLAMIAYQAASGLENAMLHEYKLEESRREALLFRLVTQIRDSLDLDTILETAVSEIRSLLEIDRCFFMWYRPRPTRSTWEVVEEAKNPELESWVGHYRATWLASLSHKLLERQSVKEDDLMSLNDPVMREFCGSRGLRAIVVLPIQTRTGEIGAIACGSCGTTRPWSSGEVELLQAVADRLAIAIEHAQMYENSRNAAAVAEAQAQQLQQALDELKQTQVQLIQSEKMSGLGQMVAGIAHEINNPVNFISGNLEYAKQYTQELLDLIDLYQQHYRQPVREIQEQIEAMDLDFLKADCSNLLSSMVMGTERIRAIVQSLRNFSRLDEAQMKAADIHEGIDSTLLILQHRLKPKPGRAPIAVVKEYGSLPRVECYASSLNQVFMNLLANAIDAIEEHPEKPGQILIHTEIATGEWKPTSQQKQQFPSPNSEYVIIQICDNGSGIPEAVQKRLFDPFFTTKPTGKGTGLGLSISYRIVVEKHGGHLACFSQPGEGTQFAIAIPLKTAVPCNTPTLKNYPSNRVLTS